ncbi:hypothetical protein J4734_23860 [Klebsiella pneumoniae]|uniref:Transposase n=1 Tax=Klebsiella pneumoniae TaxID=573 RepID=A0A939SW88_KLEPN|nr:hypothetical protein [Klebsiella pneumoniae]
MANRRREKPSNNQLPDGLAQYALSIIRERYTDFGPTLACENLAELHDVHLSKIVRSLMVKAGRWLLTKQRAPKFSNHVIAGLLRRTDPDCWLRPSWFENLARLYRTGLHR